VLTRSSNSLEGLPQLLYPTFKKMSPAAACMNSLAAGIDHLGHSLTRASQEKSNLE
jgi:hypothetical protein